MRNRLIQKKHLPLYLIFIISVFRIFKRYLIYNALFYNIQLRRHALSWVADSAQRYLRVGRIADSIVRAFAPAD